MPFRRRRRGATGLTTGSSICRSSNSMNRSKSLICTRNGYLNRSTHGPRKSRGRFAAGQLGRASGLGRGSVENRLGLGASLGVKDLEVVVAVTQLVGELDHLETPRPRTQALRGELDDYSPAGSMQRLR